MAEFVLEPHHYLMFWFQYAQWMSTTVSATRQANYCQERLETHWKTWYTEDDFKSIKDAGLNAVRESIGYWAYELLDNDPYVQGQDKYLEQALSGVEIMILRHGSTCTVLLDQMGLITHPPNGATMSR